MVVVLLLRLLPDLVPEGVPAVMCLVGKMKIRLSGTSYVKRGLASTRNAVFCFVFWNGGVDAWGEQEAT